MLLRILQAVIGFVIVVMTLSDVFETVVVPGGSRASLQVARRLRGMLLPLWRKLRRGGVSSTFAPVLLVATFVTWSVLMVFGFGLMCYSLGSRFIPAIHSLPEAMYLAGSSMVTLGPTESTALGAARWVVIGAGFSGLAAITLAVTYLLEVQSSIARRDTGIYKLNTAGGEPPSALTLLETYAALGCKQELPDVLRQSRDWCTTVRQSHASHPSLIYFRSTGTGAGWPAALGAILDLSLMCSRLIADDEWRGLALLLRAEGLRMIEELSRVVRIESRDEEVTETDLAEVRRRLTEAGYRMRPDVDITATLRERRADMGCVKAMADHLGKPSTPFLPPPFAA